MRNIEGRRATAHRTTSAEIVRLARRLLVANGVEGVTLRPIATAIGVTAPGLYRYFPSRADLLRQLTADLYNELALEMEMARDVLPVEDLLGRLAAVTRSFRRWSTTHSAEFQLVFATPLGTVSHDDDQLRAAANRFGEIFLRAFVDIWSQHRFAVPDLAVMDPAMIDQLEQWQVRGSIPLPIPASQVFLECWVQLYGLISMEIFGHLTWALPDAEPMFEAMLSQVLARLAPVGDRAAGDQVVSGNGGQTRPLR